MDCIRKFLSGRSLQAVCRFSIFFLCNIIGIQYLTAASAAQIIADAADRSATQGADIAEVITAVESAAESASGSDKRSLYAFLGELTEQAGMYDAAAKWYASAAGIAAAPASGTTAYTSEQLVLAAVRAALSGGDYETADTYLASIRNTRTEATAAYVRLYTVWAWLCRAETEEDLLEPVVLLTSYADLPSMQNLRPVIYLTLWFVTGSAEWSGKLAGEFPDTPEAAVVSGSAELVPSPFWYFLPRPESAVLATGVAGKEMDDTSVNSPAGGGQRTGTAASGQETIVRHQLGFFRNKENAERLAERVREAGFSPDITEETRSSGTVYFVVTVREDASGSVSLKLKNAGFESYPVYSNE